MEEIIVRRHDKMGWVFKVGKRYQITIRKLAPVLHIKPGDKLVFELDDGRVEVRKKHV